MNIAEIISTVAFANVREGASFTQHDVGGNMTIGVMDAAAILGGAGDIMQAQILEELLVLILKPHTTPDAAFFQSLHQAVLDYRDFQIGSGSVVEDFDDKVIRTHAPVIQKIREIAKELGVTYVEPPDKHSQGKS